MKAKGKAKPTVSLEIRSVYLLRNYILPFLNSMHFISKKRHDFRDFILICNALYSGKHLHDNEIKDLILKVSLTMNDFRLSTNKAYSQKVTLASDELTILKNIACSSPSTSWESMEGLVSSLNNNVVYHIVSPTKELIVSSLKETSEIVNVNSNTLSKLFKASGSNSVEVNNNSVRIVKVFSEHTSSQ